MNASGHTNLSGTTDTSYRGGGSNSSHKDRPRSNSHDYNSQTNRLGHTSYETTSSPNRSALRQRLKVNVSPGKELESNPPGYPSSSPPVSGTTVRELRRQLWNDNEILQVSISSSYGEKTPNSGGGGYPSDSELYHSQPKSRKNVPQRKYNNNINNLTYERDSSHFIGTRFSRSLSPGRRRYPQSTLSPSPDDVQHTHPSDEIQPSTVPPAGSTVSESSSSIGKFHSKFYEAALVARMRGKVTPQSPTSPHRQLTKKNHVEEEEYNNQKHHPPEHDVELVPEGKSGRYARESLERLPSIQRVTDHFGGRASRASYPRSNSNSRPPIHHQVPREHQHQPFQQDRQQQVVSPMDPDGRMIPSSMEARRSGRTMEASPRSRSTDGRHNSTNGKRITSPIIQERIRSLSQDRTPLRHLNTPSPSGTAPHIESHEQPTQNQHANYGTSGLQVAALKTGRDSPIDNPRNTSFDAVFGNYEHGDRNVSHDMAIAQVSKLHPGSTDRNLSYRIQQRLSPPPQLQQTSTTPTTMASTSPYDSNGDDYRLKSTVQNGHFSPSGGAGPKKNVSKLVARLNAVRRDNPEEALAQIDSILRQESRTSTSHEDVLRGRELRNYHTVGRDSPAGNVPDDEGAEDDDIDDDDVGDDETSAVSSITNPTYQEPSRVYSDHVRVLTMNNSQRSDGQNNGPSGGDIDQDPSTKLGFLPSTSSFRRPRPSNLQNYTLPVSSPDNGLITSRTELKRQQLKEFPPPTTIAVKDTKSAIATETPDEKLDIRITDYSQPGKMYEEEDNSIIEVEPKSLESKATARVFDSHQNVPDRKLDNFISTKQAQQALAEKIRVWDDLSHGVPRPAFEMVNEGQQFGMISKDPPPKPDPPKVSSRRHPWDARNERGVLGDLDHSTSVEAESSIGQNRAMVEDSKISTLNETSHKSHNSGESATHFQDSRSRIKERAEEYIPIDQTYHIDTQRISIPQFQIPNNALLDETLDSESSDHLIQGAYKSLHRLTPSIPKLSSPPIDPHLEGHQEESRKSTQKGEDDWIKMPPSAFFPDGSQGRTPITSEAVSKNSGVPSKLGPLFPDVSHQYSKPAVRNNPVVNDPRATSARSFPLKQRQGRPISGPIDLDESVDTDHRETRQGLVRVQHHQQHDVDSQLLNDSAEKEEIEVGLEEGGRYLGDDMKSGEGNDPDVGGTESRFNVRSLNCTTSGGHGTDSKPQERRKKGFLRAFIERKKKKGSVSVGHAASTASCAAYSTSHESRGAKSTTYVDVVSKPPTSPRRPEPTIRLLPPPPGVSDQRSTTPSRGRKTNSSQGTASRSRADSLETFRNPSMAQKFNRVMELYETNEI
jgi:hypothetical protein